MNKVISVLFIALMFCAFAGVPVYAVPTLQVHSSQGTAGTIGLDEDTWFVTQSSFDLVVVGAFKRNMDTLTNVTLVVSVPTGSEGSFTISYFDDDLVQIFLDPIISKTKVGTTGYYNPSANATVDILNNHPGVEGYPDKGFLPSPINNDDGEVVYDRANGIDFNEHYPFKEGVSDFLIYDLGDFFNLGPVNNYPTDGPIELDAGQGQEKIYSVTMEGFDWMHFDAYGLADDTWRINPASHDTTFIPAPGALLLGCIGMGIVGWLRRRRIV